MKVNLLLKVRHQILFLAYSVLFVTSKISSAYEITAQNHESSMQSIFVTAGYGALFGGAVGAAMLPFLAGGPTQNIRIVAGGASVGFLLGSAFGFYSVSKNTGNSYMNYGIIEPDDSYYYSMPATYPNQGFKKDSKINQQAKSTERYYVGALIMGNIGDLHFGFPNFWIRSSTDFEITLTNVSL